MLTDGVNSKKQEVSLLSPVEVGQDALDLLSQYSSTSTTCLIQDKKESPSSEHLVAKEEAGRPAEDRQQWDNKFQYMLACVAFAVGLGNVWRFPYLCQKNGGGAFLIPYTLMLIFEGIPLFIIELSLGQRLRKGPLQVWWEINPYLAGLGIASCIVSFLCAVYYNTVVSWCILYFFRSFKYPSPWSTCDADVNECQVASSTSYYWYRETLNIADSLDTSPSYEWRVGLALVITWTIVLLATVKGIKSSGKVIYFTALFPYVVLTIFLVRALLLPNMEDGLMHLFKPDLSHLWNARVWLDAATQIFFSLSLAFGGLIAMSSYMPENNNCYKDAIVVSVINCFTSLYAAVVIFAVIGFKANRDLENCIANNRSGGCRLEDFLAKGVSGTGLTFITFTEAIDHFGVLSPLFAVLFFLMLMSLGFGSLFGTVQGVITSLHDAKFLANVPNEITTVILCACSLCLAQLFALSSGDYLLQIFDTWVGTVPLLVVAFFEVIAVGYFYGVRRFSEDIYLMCGEKPSVLFMLCWKYISPCVMSVILLGFLCNVATDGITYFRYDKEIGEAVAAPMPTWGIMFALLLTTVSLVAIPVAAILHKFVFQLPPVIPSYFPEEELRAQHPIDDSFMSSRLEQLLFPK
ncbi:sodium-dependent neutral amino acid transporter B(0)AT3-like isoform X1 [Convolutriloba macropyga]|uniref:sodium-dependent neutral amino acid transporter B(0)AT3-like isoform X1 n=1 Tax=Convolutriloba macropyga TaxID=536237 RepID=UPI003F5235A4